MTQTPFQRALDGYEDAIFRLPAHRRRECIDRTLAHMRRTLPSDYRRTQRYEFRTLANDGTVCQHHAIVDAVNAFPAMRDRCVVSVAQAHHQRFWWLPFLLIWNSVTSGIDVFEYAVNWWLVQQRWCPRFALGPVLASLALICSDVRRTQASGSRVPSWCLAWQRAPIVGIKVCAWRIGWLQGWQWLRRKTETASPHDQPDYSFLPSALRVALAALALCVVLWPQHADAQVMTAAVSSAMVWQTQTDGSDSNGGGFKAGATGTDYSQQASAQAATTTATVVHSTTTQVNVSAGDATVSSTWVGNAWQLNSGTATAGVYEITAVDVPNNRITLDRAVGTAGQTCAGAMGGAFASPGKVGSVQVAANPVWIKSGTYTLSSTTSNVSGGRILTSVAGVWEGFGSSRGDLGTAPLLQAASSGFTSTTMWFNNTNINAVARNISVDGASKTSIAGWGGGNQVGTFYRIAAFNCTTSAGIFNRQFVRGQANGCSVTAISIASSTYGLGAESWGNSAAGITLNQGGLAFFLTYSNTGASTEGLASTGFQVCNNGATYGNGRDGVRLSDARPCFFATILTEANSGAGFHGAGTARPYAMLLTCGGYNNTGGNVNADFTGASENFVTGSASFFTNPGSGDFSLNNTAGGGAAARAAGYPGVFPRGLTTGYVDIGAAQHQDSGGAAVPVIGGSIIRSATLWS